MRELESFGKAPTGEAPALPGNSNDAHVPVAMNKRGFEFTDFCATIWTVTGGSSRLRDVMVAEDFWSTALFALHRARQDELEPVLFELCTRGAEVQKHRPVLAALCKLGKFDSAVQSHCQTVHSPKKLNRM